MTTLGDVLTFAGRPERITDPDRETFVTVRMGGGGAVRRRIGDGKTPVAFTGYRVEVGQFIYSRIDARNGAFALVPDDLNGAVVSKDFPVFNVDDTRIDRSFLVHFFKAGSLQRAIRAASFGATNRQRISEEVLLSFPIWLPDLAEQRRIAAILDKADAIRAKRRQVLADLDALIQSIFHDMFGDPSAWPSMWRMGTIGDMVESTQYGTSAKAGDSGAWPIIRMGNVTDDGRLDLTDLKYLDLSEHEVGRYSVRRGDLLFNRTNSKEKVGKSCVVDTDRPLALAGYLVRVRLTAEHQPEFVSAYLGSTHGRAIRQRMAKTAVNQANINAREMQTIPIALPPSEVQMEFVRRVSAARAKARQIAGLPLEALFTSLHSRAFKGEI